MRNARSRGAQGLSSTFRLRPEDTARESGGKYVRLRRTRVANKKDDAFQGDVLILVSQSGRSDLNGRRPAGEAAGSQLVRCVALMESTLYGQLLHHALTPWRIFEPESSMPPHNHSACEVIIGPDSIVIRVAARRGDRHGVDHQFDAVDRVPRQIRSGAWLAHEEAGFEHGD